MLFDNNDPKKILENIYIYRNEQELNKKPFTSLFITFIEDKADFSELLTNWFNCNNKIEIKDYTLLSFFSKIKYEFNKNQFRTIESFDNYLINDVNEYYLKNNVRETSEEEIDEFVRSHTESEHRIVAIDCEMIETIMGSELARVSIVDENRKVIYDNTILPDYPVVDYRTQYSGLTKDCFDCAISKDKMYYDIKKIIGKNTVIVGCNLSIDLFYLKFYHKKLIDIQFLFTEQNKRSLKFLSKKYLGKNIQVREHCSAEDAIASLELLYYYNNVRDESTLKDIIFILNTQADNKFIKIKQKYLFLIQKEELEELKEIDRDDILYVFFFRNEEDRLFLLC